MIDTAVMIEDADEIIARYPEEGPIIVKLFENEGRAWWIPGFVDWLTDNYKITPKAGVK